MPENVNRPPVWQMVKEAVEALGSPTTNVAVRDWVLAKYPGTKTSTIACQIITCTVNHPSRIHYGSNQKPRIADRSDDFLLRPGRGQLELYDPEKHGAWEIAETESGKLLVRQVDADRPPEPTIDTAETFAMETHLRDYLAANLGKIEEGLELYADEDGNTGVEYQTPIGRIDILAVDRDGGFLVIELKVSRGADAACGQVLRYKGWVRQHVAGDKSVRGMVIARRITDRIKYAVGEVPDVELREYTLEVTVHPVSP